MNDAECAKLVEVEQRAATNFELLPSIRQMFPCECREAGKQEPDPHCLSITHDTPTSSDEWTMNTRLHSLLSEQEDSTSSCSYSSSQESSVCSTSSRRSSRASSASVPSSVLGRACNLNTPPDTRATTPAPDTDEETAKKMADWSAAYDLAYEQPLPHPTNEARRRQESAELTDMAESLLPPVHIQLCKEHGGKLGRSVQNDGKSAKMAVTFFGICWIGYCALGGDNKNIDEDLDVCVIKSIAEKWEQHRLSDEAFQEQLFWTNKQHAFNKRFSKHFQSSKRSRGIVKASRRSKL